MAAANKKALDAPTGTTFKLDPFVPRIIGLDTKHDASNHVLFDPRIFKKLLEEDILNVLKIGIQEPIIVCKDGDDYIDVVDGQHRTRWLREVCKRLAAQGVPPEKLPRLESKLWKPTDPARRDIELLMLKNSLNTIRRQDDPLAEAKAMQRMLSFGAAESDVTLAFGQMSIATMKNRLKLLELDVKVINVLEGKVDGKRLSFSAAAELAAEPRENQVALMDKLIAEGRATKEEVVREVTVARETRATEAAKPADNRRSKPEDKAKPAKAKTAPANDHSAKPKMVVLNRLLQLQEIGTIEMHESFCDAIKWMLGRKSSSKIEGLNAMLKFAEKPVKKPAK